MLFALLIACTTQPADTAAPPAPPRPADYSGGECPVLEEGKNKDFLSAGLSRTVRIALPPEPEGAPVVFVWHWLTGSSKEFLSYTDVDRLATEWGAIVVAPDSCCGLFDWPFVHGEDAEVDLTLFDDVLSCLDQQFSIDRYRIYTTGMSAGGLWSSYLTMYRSEVLAASAPMSGGTEGMVVFEPPERPIPVLLMWGGEGDVLDAGILIDFHAANVAFSAELQDSGSWVGECVHSNGHYLPDGFTDLLIDYFDAHRWDDASAPWADGLPADWPDWCALPGAR